jgi:hypothetical protein
MVNERPQAVEREGEGRIERLLALATVVLNVLATVIGMCAQ